MNQKLLEMVPVTVLFHTDEFIFVRSFKKETCAKTAPREPKRGNFDGRVPKLGSRVTLAKSGAGVACHIYIYFNFCSNFKLNCFFRCDQRDTYLYLQFLYFYGPINMLNKIVRDFFFSKSILMR